MAGSVIGLDGHRAQAIAFLIDAYGGVRRPPGKGLPHAQAVADVLRESRYDEDTQILGLLHDVVEDARVSDGDVRAAFGAEIGDMVAAQRKPIPFRLLLDDDAPRQSRGLDVDEDGNGLLRESRVYQLIRQRDLIKERTLKITFYEAGSRRTHSPLGQLQDSDLRHSARPIEGLAPRAQEASHRDHRASSSSTNPSGQTCSSVTGDIMLAHTEASQGGGIQRLEAGLRPAAPRGRGRGGQFSDTFTSRYIDTGDVRLHAVIGGDGPPLLLNHGWPGSWYYWRLVMPALARDFELSPLTRAASGSRLSRPSWNFVTAVPM